MRLSKSDLDIRIMALQDAIDDRDSYIDSLTTSTGAIYDACQEHAARSKQLVKSYQALRLKLCIERDRRA